MQGVGSARELRMATIHRESVLRQIVAADRQKIDFPEETGRHERRGGGFDHRAQINASMDAHLGLDLIDDASHSEYFRDVGDHRDQ